jgi:minor histocompatibility antigen H13
VGSVQIGAILLCGLFLYDIFWVFCTPVMVAVAKSFDAPIKLLFPRVLATLISGQVLLPATLISGQVLLPAPCTPLRPTPPRPSR